MEMPVLSLTDLLRRSAVLLAVAALAGSPLAVLAQQSDPPAKRQTQQKPPAKPRTTTTAPKPSDKQSAAAKTEALPPSQVGIMTLRGIPLSQASSKFIELIEA